MQKKETSNLVSLESLQGWQWHIKPDFRMQFDGNDAIFFFVRK